MKKLLIALGIVATFIAATAFIIPDKTNSLPGPGSMCKVVGNCTVNLLGPGRNNEYTVDATNNNNYKVTIEWTAIGYKDGNKRQVGSGTISLEPRGEDGYHSNRNHFRTTCEDVSLDVVRVLKCE